MPLERLGRTQPRKGRELAWGHTQVERMRPDPGSGPWITGSPGVACLPSQAWTSSAVSTGIPQEG